MTVRRVIEKARRVHPFTVFMYLAIAALGFSVLYFTASSFWYSQYPPYTYIAIKQIDNDTVLIWSDEYMKYDDAEGYTLSLQGNLTTVEDLIKNITFEINGRQAVVSKYHPAVADVVPFSGITGFGTPDIVYKVYLDYDR